MSLQYLYQAFKGHIMAIFHSPVLFPVQIIIQSKIFIAFIPLLYPKLPETYSYFPEIFVNMFVALAHSGNNGVALY